MSRLLHKRKSSTGSKHRKTSDRQLSTDAIKEESSITLDENRCGESLSRLTVEKPNINYQDELVLVFFDSMLNNIIEEWLTIPPEPPVICVCKKEEKAEEVIVKEFKELLANDIQNMVITDVQGSKVSLTKKKRRSSTGSKKSQKPPLQDLITKKSGSERKSKISLKQANKNSAINETMGRHSLTSSCTGLSTSQELSYSTDWFLNPPNENVFIQFKNGNCYEGPVSNKLMHGFGKFTWANGTVYEGDFVYGRATGKGTLKYSDLTFYYGDFCNSLLHGEGVLNISSTSTIYSGNWKDGKKHDQGWLLYEPGNWYEGEWFADQRQGVGLRFYETGEKYKGNWYEGSRHGQGTILWPNNDFYNGEWFGGLMHGYGEYTWNAFLNESFTFPLENIYQGSWANGARNGVGIMIFGTEGGARLAGMWENNNKHGAGVMVCGNGATIERNPLFIDDKPIHLEPGIDFGTPRNPTKSKLDMVKTKSTLQLISERVNNKQASNKFDSEILESVTKSQHHFKVKTRPDFPYGKIECSPLHIPVHLAPEEIDFSYYINLAVVEYTKQLYNSAHENELEDVNICGGIKSNDGSPSTILKYSKWNISLISADMSKTLKYSQKSDNLTMSNSETEARLVAIQQIQYEIEERHLRNTIILNLPQLSQVYDKYATITTQQRLNFKPILIRLFLWQFLRDLGVIQKRSLVEMDRLLFDNSECGLESKHYPFERVYFWQFLKILIHLAWMSHSANDVSMECKRMGILSTILSKFLDNTVFGNLGIASSCSIFEYRDLVPINSMYLLYQSNGEPHTARKFLNSVCTKKREHPPCYLKIFQDEPTPTLISGINAVPVGGNIVFLPDDPPDFGEPPPEPPLHYPYPEDPFRKQLYALRSLGPKRVVRCLIDVCPKITEDGVIVNMEYPLTFIEFYETLLMCAFMAVDKVKGREERIRLRKEQKRLAELALLEQEENKTVLFKNLKDKKRKSK